MQLTFYGILQDIFDTASILMAFYKALMKATKIFIVFCVFESRNSYIFCLVRWILDVCQCFCCDFAVVS